MSRAPLAKLRAYKQRMGWTFPWASSLDGDFNFDFNVSFTEDQQRKGSVEYNQRAGHAMDATPAPEPVAQLAAVCGTDAPTYSRDRPGMSAFVLEDGVVYHTYSTYARGVDSLWGMYQWLDRAPKGATRRASGGAATTSTTSAEPRVSSAQRISAEDASARPLGARAERSCIRLHGCETPRPPHRPRRIGMSNLVHNEQVKLSATFLNNLAVAMLIGVFLIPAFYTRRTILQQALSICIGLAAAIGLRMAAHWWLRRLRE